MNIKRLTWNNCCPLKDLRSLLLVSFRHVESVGVVFLVRYAEVVAYTLRICHGIILDALGFILVYFESPQGK